MNQIPVRSDIPPERVVSFNLFDPPGATEDYFAAWQTLQGPGKPGLVWTTANGGHWIATSGAIVRALWEDHAQFSSECLAVTPGLGEVMQFIPLQLDPPDHGPYRLNVVKGFGSRYIAALEPHIENTARELIGGIIGRGHCDFIADFAEIMPINIFLSLIDVPISDRPRLRALGLQLTKPDGSMTVEQLKQAADDYLEPYVRARLANPGTDLFSRILSEPLGARPWGFDEARRLCRNLLFGGLDTVAAMLGMVALHLARHPDDQRLLRDRPELIPDAADELMRRYPTVSVSRNAVVDVVVDGMQIRRGDIVYLPSVLHNLDPNCFAEPERVKFERHLNPARHTTMGAGVHRCVGAALARQEVIVFLREWLGRMPEFGLDPALMVRMKGGNVGAATSIPLRWCT